MNEAWAWTFVTVPCKHCHETGAIRGWVCWACNGKGTYQSARLTSVPADAAALPVADGTPMTEPIAATGGTAEHHR